MSVLTHRLSRGVGQPTPRFVLIGVLCLGVIATLPGGRLAQASPPDPTPLPMASPPSLLLPPLPASATQADHGEQIYGLICRDCHGDRGQGLTDEWRAQWAPEDQNCWQSKCHASNHPPEGFELPHYIPAIIGPGTLTRFANAQALHDFIRANMPWYSPGSLSDEKAWAVTAYLARARGLLPEGMTLDVSNAAALRLQPGTAPVAPAPHEIALAVSIGVSAALGLAALGLLFWRSRSHARPLH